MPLGTGAALLSLPKSLEMPRPPTLAEVLAAGSAVRPLAEPKAPGP